MTKGVQDLMVEVERVRDLFHAAMFGGADLLEAFQVLHPDCVLVNLPVDTGAREPGPIFDYVTEKLRPCLPSDLSFSQLSRTGNRWRVVDEMTVRFTHDREMPWLLPGIAPIGRPVEVLAISSVEVRRSVITSHRTLWDYAALLDQLGKPISVLPSTEPASP